MKVLPLIAIALVGISACASADRAPDILAAGDPVVADEKVDRVVCRRQREVGSHVPVTVCLPESQMEAERGELQKAIGPLRPMTGDTRDLDIQTLPNH